MARLGDSARDALGAQPERVLLAALAALTLWRLAALAIAAPPLQFDEAQYWYWAQQLEWGYYSKPPLIAWGIAASTALFGDGMLAVRLPTLLCYPVAAWAMFHAARRAFPDAGPTAGRIALIAALAYATLPTVSFYSWAATTDGWLILCWALATWALLVALDEGRWRDWLLLGAAVGAGLLAKYAMAVFGVSAALYLLLHARPRLGSAKPWVAAALALLIVAPNLMWNAHNGFATFRHTADIAHLDDALFHPGALAEFAASQFAVFGPLMMTALIALLWSRVRRRGTRELHPGSPAAMAPRDNMALLLWLGLPMLGVILVEAFLARAFANWAQAAYVPLTIAVIAWLAANARWTLIKLSFAIHLAFAAVLYHHGSVLGALGVEPPRALDLTVRLRLWPAVGTEVSALLAARPGAALLSDEREVLAEMAYYARGVRPVLAAFNPERQASDHFRLTHDLIDSPSTRFVVVSRHLTAADLAPSFSDVTELAPLRIAVRSDRTVTLRVFEAEGFHGYRP